MKYVVIGSKGFIGNAVFKSLLNNCRHQVIGVSRENFDLTCKISIKKLTRLIKEDDVIIFCAAEAPVKNLDMFTNNIIMINELLQHLKSINIKNFVYVSSDAVYSDSMNLINENSETNPDNLHGIMHLTREKVLLNTFPKKHLIVRPTLIYGYEDPHQGYGPNKFINTSIDNNKIELFGKGEELRDHISIDDVTNLLVNLILENKTGIFNLVSGGLFSFYHIAETISKYANKRGINVDIIYKERTTAIPHNGYRKLCNKKVLNLFRQYKISNFEKNIEKYFEISVSNRN